MKFSTREDIEAPIADAFALFSDFDQFERSALRRGAEVRRTDSPKKTGAGMTWKAAFKLRGKNRKVDAELVGFDLNESYTLDLQGGDVSGVATLELMELSKSRTRASLSVELKPKSLSGRLMLQTMRLGKTRLSKRFKTKAAEFVRALELKYKATQSA